MKNLLSGVKHAVLAASTAAMLLAAGPALFLGVSPALAASCSGDACDDISITYENGCYKVTNWGGRRVQVWFGMYGKELQRGEEWWLHIGGQCIQMVVGETTANYVN